MSQKGSSKFFAIEVGQLRAARALLGWSQTQLAEKAGLSLPTVKRVENVGGARVSDLARHALQRALETGGVDFIDENGGGPGVRLRGRTRAKKAR
jgi:transcriptional regulator with XRE-family HTH domain